MPRLLRGATLSRPARLPELVRRTDLRGLRGRMQGEMPQVSGDAGGVRACAR